jgi:hypothetical protein
MHIYFKVTPRRACKKDPFYGRYFYHLSTIPFATKEDAIQMIRDYDAPVEWFRITNHSKVGVDA